MHAKYDLSVRRLISGQDWALGLAAPSRINIKNWLLNVLFHS